MKVYEEVSGYRYAPQSVQVWSKSGSNEEHFIVETGTLFRRYLHCHCSRVTEKSHVALPVHAPETVQIWSKSCTKEGHFTLAAETIFRP
jgi:hypothetical protein